MTVGRFRLALAAIVLGGLGLRLLFAQVGHYGGGGADDTWYHLMANAVADGRGFNVPLHAVTGTGPPDAYTGPVVPTALHPPLFPSLLAIPSTLGLDSYGQHRAFGCAFGAATVGVVGLIGRRIAGVHLGLLAAGLAAIYPPLIVNDSVLLSESLYGLTIAATILAALWFMEAPSWRRGAALGAAIGLAALTRSEALLLLVLLVPFAVRHRGSAGAARNALAVVAATAVVVMPWCVRNTSVFDRPVGITTGDGPVIAGANVDATYYGERLGAWDLGGLAIVRPKDPGGFNDAADSARLRRKGLDYARDHAARVPLVALARTLRTWTVYPLDPSAKVRYNAFAAARHQWAEWAAMLGGWVAMALAAVGAVALRRRGARLAPLIAPLVLVTVVSALFFGDPRFRQAADVSLIVLAAAGVQALAQRSARRLPATRPG